MSTIDAPTSSRIAKILLGCGILSSVLYFASDIVMSLTYRDYSYLHQTVSELNAIGAPTRQLSIVFGLAGYVLLIAFGEGIWISAPGNLRLWIVAALLALMGATAPWAVPFASMQMRGTPQEGPHLVSGIVGVLVLLAAIAMAASSFDKRFRLYSMATLLLMLVFAGWAGMEAGSIEAGLPTPWVGLKERISFYSWHFWFVVLALMLLRRPGWGRPEASL